MLKLCHPPKGVNVAPCLQAGILLLWQMIAYTYDQLNRLTQKSYPDTSTVNYTYDLDSRLTQVTDD